MTKIDFDEPSTGTVNSETTALTIISSRSGCIRCESTNDLALPSIISKSKGIAIRGDGGIGIYGESATASGVVGNGKENGVRGVSFGPNGRAVEAICRSTEGTNVGLEASIKSNAGYVVLGSADGSGPDSFGKGVGGFSSGVDGQGVVGVCERGTGIFGSGRIAGRFEGDVEVTGDIKLLNPQNADCAEEFDILEHNVKPGTVMVLTKNGSLQSSRQEYDKKVAGVVSGAGGYTPAMVLAREQQSVVSKNDKKKDRLPIALIGKVYCKVDARQSPIETGDLLTTSSTKGYAMKAEDPVRAFGTVIGKALGSLKEGIGMIPILVTLQ
jgi:hypothetical protein